MHIQYLLECRWRETHPPICSRPLSFLSHALFLFIVRSCLPFFMVFCRHCYTCCYSISMFYPPLPPSYGKSYLCPSVILFERSLICVMKVVCLLSPFITINSQYS